MPGGSSTTRLLLHKPDPTGVDVVSVVGDLNNNWDKIDSVVGFVACTSSTRPASPFTGQGIFETDTGKIRFWDGTGWSEILASKATSYAQGITIASGNATLNSGKVAVTQSTSTAVAMDAQATGDANKRFQLGVDGKMWWGNGTSALDTNLYRVGSSQLKTDDAFWTASNLTADGDTALGGNLSVAGIFSIGGAVYDTQTSTFPQVANTTTETTLAQLSIAAGATQVGAVYRCRVWGNLSVTGTPTITFRSNISGLGILTIPAITVRSGATDGNWDLEFLVSTKSVGVSGTWGQMLKGTHNFLTSATTYTSVGPLVGANVTADTTVARTLNLTAQWGTASASNVLNVQGAILERVA